ncbi:MAG: tetraacyldisaccharide 4'-kinase [Bacteroidales bacterium]|nr:tetraacyldisaccharide 4'-kinase [Bacteroidales bacterium]
MKFLLFPISLVYRFLVSIRNFLFNSGILPSKRFPVSVISVGNLSLGGTGKTPMVEYIVRLLTSKGYFSAILSRGYRRRSRGYKEAQKEMTWYDVGDEPLQYKQKFLEIPVAVDASRRHGIKNLLIQHSDLDNIVLDDAYQHRWVHRDINILLTQYDNPFYNDYLLPMGRLREPKKNFKRADIIVISKCPIVLSPLAERYHLTKFKPGPHQKVFFTYIKYGDPVHFSGDPCFCDLNNLNTIIMFSGIANPTPFEEKLKKRCDHLFCHNFGDHHVYKHKDIDRIAESFNNLFTNRKVIITTEKDAMRIKGTKLFERFKNLPVFFLPIEICFHKDRSEFDKIILSYGKKNPDHH